MRVNPGLNRLTNKGTTVFPFSTPWGGLYAKMCDDCQKNTMVYNNQGIGSFQSVPGANATYPPIGNRPIAKGNVKYP